MNKIVMTPQAGAPPPPGKPPVTWRRRLDVGSRIVAGLLMGYVVAGLTAAVLARLLPMSKVEATTTGMLVSFAVYAAVAIWAFGDPKVWRVWFGLLAACALMSGALWLSIRLGGQS